MTNPGEVYVANGEQAEVIAIDGNVITAKLTSPDRTILIYRKGKSDQQKAAEDAAKGEEDENENGEAGESSNTGCSWDLGFAQSCHKCQGSEWPIVIVMLDSDNAASRTCSRQWIYTGVSRIKLFGFAIGTKKTADKMCGRDALFARKTFLKERVEELKAATDEAEKPLPPAEELPDAESLVDEYDFSDILEGIL